MTRTRFIALVVGALSSCLALAWFVPREASYADRIMFLAALLIAIANAWLVATLSRLHRTRSATLALWLVLGGAGIAVALGTSEVWIPAVVHNDGSLIGMFAYAAQVGWIVTALIWGGLIALTLGWAGWFAIRLSSRPHID